MVNIKEDTGKGHFGLKENLIAHLNNLFEEASEDVKDARIEYEAEMACALVDLAAEYSADLDVEYDDLPLTNTLPSLLSDFTEAFLNQHEIAVRNKSAAVTLIVTDDATPEA